MSERELHRRKVTRRVMQEAWTIFRKVMIHTFSFALKLAWKTVRSLIRVYRSKVKGVSFEGRQKIIKRLAAYPENHISLAFIREPHNPHDNNAIKISATVRSKGTAVIGYMDKNLASKIAPLLDQGHEAVVMLESITGLSRKDGLLGLNYAYILL